MANAEAKEALLSGQFGHENSTEIHTVQGGIMKPKRENRTGIKYVFLFEVICVVLFTIIVIVALLTSGHDTNASCAAPERECTKFVQMGPIKVDSESEASYCCLLDDVTEDKLTCLGIFRVTAYCGCEMCCGKWGKDRPVDENGQAIVYTAYGDIAREGVTVAADPSVFPQGTEIVIDGHTYTVQDKGGAVKGNCIDIYFENHEDARAWGVQYIEVFVK